MFWFIVGVVTSFFFISKEVKSQSKKLTKITKYAESLEKSGKLRSMENTIKADIGKHLLKIINK